MASSKTPTIPTEILTRIAKYVGKIGLKHLSGFLLSGREGRDAVLNPETLQHVTLDLHRVYPWYTNRRSAYYCMWIRLLEVCNPFAVYIESLRLAFNEGELLQAISKLSDIKHCFPLATLAYVMLNFPAGLNCFSVYMPFKSSLLLAEAIALGEDLIHNINFVEPQRQNTFGSTFYMEDFPEYWSEHEMLEDDDSVRCDGCVFYNMAKEISKLL